MVNSNLTTESVDTHNKALKVNLDAQWYGTFAEIGAGQEVVRWFFRVGGAAGTIAKSISAYDMKVSDAIYGRSERYVSKGRLQAMLDRELELNVERLSDRGDTTALARLARSRELAGDRAGAEALAVQAADRGDSIALGLGPSPSMKNWVRPCR